MASIWKLLLLLGTLASQCEPSFVSYGTPEECQRAHMVPGYNLGGEGFDIVTMQRKGSYVIDTETWNLGNGTCRLYTNSYMCREKQKVPVAVVDWRALPKCSLTVSSTAYDSAESFVNDSTSSVRNNWTIGLELPSVTLGMGFGGSHSKEAKFGMQKSKQDRYNFYRHSVYCSFYSFRLATTPPMSKDFLSAVNALPKYTEQSAALYRSLIDKYGTHYIRQVYLGGEIKAITSVKTCEASVNELTETEVMDCLSVEASATFASTASVKAMLEHCRARMKKLGHNDSFSSTFSERYTEVTGGHISGADVLFDSKTDPCWYNNWLNTLKSSPDVIEYNLEPLHTILYHGHSAIIGIKKEIETYIKKNALLKKCSETCQFGHRSNPRDSCACVCNSNTNLRSNCCPVGKGRATLKVFKLYAENLYGDRCGKTGSVEVKYGDQVKRTHTISNDDNPRWREKFEFGPIIINMKNKLQFKVYNKDSYWNSDLLGECSFDLRQGIVKDSCMLNHGTFFFSYQVECAPSLGGEQCQDHVPSPLSSSVAKQFYTRNGVLWGDVMG